MTSTYFGSSSIPQQTRSVSSAAARVVAPSQERFVDQLASLGMVQNRAPHQLDRLLGGVIELSFI